MENFIFSAVRNVDGYEIISTQQLANKFTTPSTLIPILIPITKARSIPTTDTR